MANSKHELSLASSNTQIAVLEFKKFPEFNLNYLEYKAISKTEHFWIVSLILASLTVPQLLMFLQPIIGVYAVVAAFTLLLIIALYSKWARKLAISAAILPLATISAICFQSIPEFTRLVIYYDVIAILALTYRYIFSVSITFNKVRLFTKKNVVLISTIIVLGLVMGEIEFLLLRHHYTYQGVDLPLIFFGAVLFAIAEVVYFQGLLQELASRITNPKVAVIISVVAYTFASISHTSVLTAVFALISGTVLSLTYQAKKNLALTSIINITMKLTYVSLIAAYVLR